MARHETGTRSGEDIEALHDMRVASRRLRESLEIFQFCFPAKNYDYLYNRVRRVTRALGQARNADVAVAYFSGLLDESRDLLGQFALQDALRRLTRQQRRRRAKMQTELDKVQPEALLANFEKAFAKLEQSPVPRRGPRTALSLARRLLAQRLREVFTCRQLLKGEGDVEGLHKLRIAVKKLRYAIETLDFAVSESAKESLRFFKKLQTVLGELHDRDVFVEIVQERTGKLKKQAFATHLLNGYELISASILFQRQDFYAEYLALFGAAKIQEWRSLVVPPASTRPRVAPLLAPPLAETPESIPAHAI
jgi:CHAD domain-containing protein